MKKIQNLLTAIFLLVRVPASASAALIVSDWTATPTSLSFDITGTIEAGVTIGPSQANRLFIGPSNLVGENKPTVSGTITSLGGSPTTLGYAKFFNDSGGGKLQIQKNGGNWAVGDMLNYSISFSSSNLYDVTAWNPAGGIVSAGRTGLSSWLVQRRPRHRLHSSSSRSWGCGSSLC